MSECPFLFQLWSDLHLEICDLQLSMYVPRAPYLLLAGDIGVPGSARYCALLAKVAPAHDLVFVVTGNHEYYGSSLLATDKAMQVMCHAAGPNVIFLNNASYDITSLSCRILGSTLWSHVTDDQADDVACFVADHRLIDTWGVCRNNTRHSVDVAFLRSEIIRAKADGVRLIVMTHHAPLTHGTSQPRHAGSVLSSAFQTGLSALMGPPISIWCFGHTHHCSSQVEQGTQVVSNQRGYVCISSREDADFEPDRVFCA